MLAIGAVALFILMIVVWAALPGGARTGGE